MGKRPVSSRGPTVADERARHHRTRPPIVPDAGMPPYRARPAALSGPRTPGSPDDAQATTAPRSTTRAGDSSVARPCSGLVSYTTKSAGAPSSRPELTPSHSRARHEPAPSASVRREADPLVQHPDLRRDEAVRQNPARVGSGVDRHAGLGRGTQCLVDPGEQRPHMRGVDREFASPCAAYSGKLSTCRRVGTRATPRSAIEATWSDDSPVPCSRQSIPAASRSGRASSPNTCAVTRAPSSWAFAMAAARTSPGQHGARSPISRSIQSPTSLTQPSPRRAWSATVSTSSWGSISYAVVADVALGAGDVPSGPDDVREVLALVDPAGVCRTPGVADQQRAGVTVGECLALLLLGGHGAIGVEADVAVGIDQSGYDEPVGDQVGAGVSASG